MKVPLNSVIVRQRAQVRYPYSPFKLTTTFIPAITRGIITRIHSRWTYCIKIPGRVVSQRWFNFTSSKWDRKRFARRIPERFSEKKSVERGSFPSNGRNAELAALRFGRFIAAPSVLFMYANWASWSGERQRRFYTGSRSHETAMDRNLTSVVSTRH